MNLPKQVVRLSLSATTHCITINKDNLGCPCTLLTIALIETIDYHRSIVTKTATSAGIANKEFMFYGKIFLTANRNLSDCRHKSFCLRAESILFAGRKYGRQSALLIRPYRFTMIATL